MKSLIQTIQRNGEQVPLVEKTTPLFTSSQPQEKPNFFTSPLFVFILIAVLLIGITYRDLKRNHRTRSLDVAIFVITGVVGILLALLWFATDHSATANNYNLLWAFPFSVLLSFAIAKKQPKIWVRRYVLFLTLMLALLVMHWVTGVQEFAYGFIPLFIALGVRYLYLLKVLKQ
ncbi:MAG: hypothetical protein CMC70_03075 [Flavobacteriaceae bacterium]|nr:hypothetical protein [Flavobacteriaceae bacterium]